MKLLKVVLATAMFFTSAVSADARYVQSVKARYQTADGQSEWYVLDVTFMTGLELNTATRTMNYDSLGGRYAIIFWSEGQASVIKLDGVSFCGINFTNACLNVIGNMEGSDQAGHKWEICAQFYCF
jgi:hypothetical protein